MNDIDILARQLLSIREGIDAALMIIQKIKGIDQDPMVDEELAAAQAKLEDPPRWNATKREGKDED